MSDWDKIEEVIRLLQTKLDEAKQVEEGRESLQASELVGTTREKFLNKREADIVSRAHSLDEQQKFIEKKALEVQTESQKRTDKEKSLNTLISQGEEAKISLEQLKATELKLDNRERYITLETEELKNQRDELDKWETTLKNSQQLDTKRKQTLDALEAKNKAEAARLQKIAESLSK